MPDLLTAREMVTRLRARVEDRQGHTFTDVEILRAADESLALMHTQLALAPGSHEMNVLATSASDWTSAEPKVHNLVLPEYVGQVHKVEGVRASGQAIDIPRTPLSVRTGVAGKSWNWLSDRPGTISFQGTLQPFATVRIYYSRRWPPLHYGTSQGGGALGTFRFGTGNAVTGKVVQRADVYTGLDIMVENDIPAGMQDAVRRIEAYSGGSTRECTVDADWPDVPTGSTQYSLVVPIAPEDTPMLIAETALVLLEEIGAAGQVQVLLPRLMEARKRFTDRIRSRDNAPKRIWNHGW